MTDVVVDTLRLRGPRAHRLARVAARALPAALERALADVADQRVDRVTVVLDLDPEEYDDETLAVLWADLVRAELVAAGGGDGSRPGPPGGAAPVVAPAGDLVAPAPADVVAVARTWLAARRDSAARAAPRVPRALLALGEPSVAAIVARELGATAWAELVAALATALRLPSAAVDAGPWAEGTPGLEERPAYDRGEAGDPSPAGASTSSDAAALPEADRALDPARPLGLLQVLAELAVDSPAPLDPATVTRCAGVVLLYPWLAEHCGRAEELHPGLDPVPVREAALAALLDDPGAVDDPLVRLLAGRPEPCADTEPLPRVPLPRAGEVACSAERVLASFTALLPGFGRSTPGFVRASWLVRPGLLDTDRDPALLTAATQPLDVLLPLLPYPLGLFRLPWSPPLSVRLRP